jgi:Flp pilus assembly pilin Flp
VKKSRIFSQFLHEERGQGMVEYVIVTAYVIAGVIAINAFIVPPLNDLYELIANVASLPFP